MSELKIHSDKAWEIASHFSDVLASDTRTLAAMIDIALAAPTPPPSPHLLGDVVSVRDDGNAITLHFAEIKSAKAFRDTFPTKLVRPSPSDQLRGGSA